VWEYLLIYAALLAILIQILPPVPCGPDNCIIKRNLGGKIKEFKEQAHQVVADKKPVIVDGLCLSACTIFVDIARDQVCLTEKALLAYHQGFIPKTPFRFDINYETPGLNQYIKEHGGLPSPGSGKFLTINFEQGKQFYKPCPT
jgi:hypothetical protein